MVIETFLALRMASSFDFYSSIGHSYSPYIPSCGMNICRTARTLHRPPSSSFKTDRSNTSRSSSIITPSTKHARCLKVVPLCIAVRRTTLGINASLFHLIPARFSAFYSPASRCLFHSPTLRRYVPQQKLVRRTTFSCATDLQNLPRRFDRFEVIP